MKCLVKGELVGDSGSVSVFKEDILRFVSVFVVGIFIMGMVGALYAQEDVEGDSHESMEETQMQGVQGDSVEDSIGEVSVRFSGDLGEEVKSVWINISGGMLFQGVSDVYVFEGGKVMLAGGNGYVAKSTDGGLFWKVRFNFDEEGLSSGMLEGEEAGEIESAMRDDVEDRIQILREYLSLELESQFGQDVSDFLMMQISDADLELAEDIDEIDVLSTLNFEGETDLNEIFNNLRADKIEGKRYSRHFGLLYHEALAMGASVSEAVEVAYDGFSMGGFYKGFGEGHVFSVTRGGVFFSRDFGESWNLIIPHSLLDGVLSLSILEQEDVLLMGTLSGIRRSLDMGVSSENVKSNVSGAVFQLLSGSGRDFYALSTEGLWKSADGGQSWQPIGPEYSKFIKVAYLDGVLVALGMDSLYVSRDGGAHFEMVEVGVLGETYFRDVELIRDGRSLGYLLVGEKGVYRGISGKWMSVLNGLSGQELVGIRGGADGQYYLSSRLGLLRLYDISEMSEEVLVKYRAMMKEWQMEPKLDSIVYHAYRSHYFDWAESNHWRLRLGLSAILPSVVVGYSCEQYRRDRDFNEYSSAWPLLSKFSQMRQNSNYWEVMGYWSLGYDFYRSQERLIETTEHGLRRERAGLVKRILSLVMVRRQLQMQKLGYIFTGRKLDLETELSLVLEQESIEAELNFLTNGFYLSFLRAKSQER